MKSIIAWILLLGVCGTLTAAEKTSFYDEPVAFLGLRDLNTETLNEYLSEIVGRFDASLGEAKPIGECQFDSLLSGWMILPQRSLAGISPPIDFKETNADQTFTDYVSAKEVAAQRAGFLTETDISDDQAIVRLISRINQVGIKAGKVVRSHEDIRQGEIHFRLHDEIATSCSSSSALDVLKIPKALISRKNKRADGIAQINLDSIPTRVRSELITQLGRSIAPFLQRFDEEPVEEWQMRTSVTSARMNLIDQLLNGLEQFRAELSLAKDGCPLRLTGQLDTVRGSVLNRRIAAYVPKSPKLKNLCSSDDALNVWFAIRPDADQRKLVRAAASLLATKCDAGFRDPVESIGKAISEHAECILKTQVIEDSVALCCVIPCDANSESLRAIWHLAEYFGMTVSELDSDEHRMLRIDGLARQPITVSINNGALIAAYGSNNDRLAIDEICRQMVTRRRSRRGALLELSVNASKMLKLETRGVLWQKEAFSVDQLAIQVMQAFLTRREQSMAGIRTLSTASDIDSSGSLRVRLDANSNGAAVVVEVDRGLADFAVAKWLQVVASTRKSTVANAN